MQDCFSKIDPEALAFLEDRHVNNISAEGLAALSFLDDHEAEIVHDENRQHDKPTEVG